MTDKCLQSHLAATNTHFMTENAQIPIIGTEAASPQSPAIAKEVRLR